MYRNRHMHTVTEISKPAGCAGATFSQTDGAATATVITLTHTSHQERYHKQVYRWIHIDACGLFAEHAPNFKFTKTTPAQLKNTLFMSYHQNSLRRSQNKRSNWHSKYFYQAPLPSTRPASWTKVFFLLLFSLQLKSIQSSHRCQNFDPESRSQAVLSKIALKRQ